MYLLTPALGREQRCGAGIFRRKSRRIDSGTQCCCGCASVVGFRRSCAHVWCSSPGAWSEETREVLSSRTDPTAFKDTSR
jgi:hypothetical protein